MYPEKKRLISLLEDAISELEKNSLLHTILFPGTPFSE